MTDERLIEWLVAEYDATELAKRIVAMANPAQRVFLERECFEWTRRNTSKED